MQNNRSSKLFTNQYKIGVLENNWNEDRFDSHYLKELKPISNKAHAYETTYNNMNKSVQTIETDLNANMLKVHKSLPYPGYQPKFDTEHMSFETEHRVNYLDPRLKLFPIHFQHLPATVTKPN